jgi:hypothetical protein
MASHRIDVCESFTSGKISEPPFRRKQQQLMLDCVRIHQGLPIAFSCVLWKRPSAGAHALSAASSADWQRRLQRVRLPSLLGH